MLAVVLFVLGLALVAGLLFLVGAFVFGRGEELAPAQSTHSPVYFPDDRSIDAADIEALRLSVVIRGYQMVEVDWVLEQLATSVRERDQRIAELTNQLTRQEPAADAAPALVERTDGPAAPEQVGTLGPPSEPAEDAGVPAPSTGTDAKEPHL